MTMQELEMLKRISEHYGISLQELRSIVRIPRRSALERLLDNDIEPAELDMLIAELQQKLKGCNNESM